MYDLIVIGGGASGMMAAGRAGERGLKVLLLEKNKKLGEKLRITGGGRSNVTNAEFDEKILLKKYGDGEQFLYSPFSQFGVQDTFSFFEKYKLPLVVEANKRAFPVTHKAEDVVKVLETYMKEGGVEVKKGSAVASIEREGDSIVSVTVGDTVYKAKEYIFATGSVSHKETGSTGDGFNWLALLGHTVVPPTPMIVPLSVPDTWVRALSGTSLNDAKITFFVEDKKQFSLSGKILFTHFGLSGPLILNSAHKVSDLLHEGIVTAAIDLYPKVDLGILEKNIVAVFDSHKNKELKNVMRELVPEGMHKGAIIALENSLDITKKVHSITKEERRVVALLLKALPLTVDGLMGYDKAVVADGGVPLSEIDMKTMRSKKISNLLITGDLLHINRPSGGYSLQLCWSTGYVAGTSAKKG